MDKKKIILIVPSLQQGGIERMCLLTARLLQKHAQVRVVVFSEKDVFYDTSDIDVVFLKLGSRPSKMGKVLQLIKRILALRSIRRKFRADIVYSFGDTANYANVFSKSYGETWCGIRAYGSLQIKNCVMLPCKLADRVIACSQVMANEIHRMYPEKHIDVLYNPCDFLMIEQKAQETIEINGVENDNVFTIMAMGRAHDVKGFWHLIKAFSLIKQEISKCHLVFIGDGDFTEYEELAQNLGIADDVTFAGVQSNPFCILKRADLYVLTSESEGFPNALIEAMAVGVPVMSVNCKSGPAEILSEDYKLLKDDTKVYHEKYGILLPAINGVKDLDPTHMDQEDKIIAQEMIKFYNDEEMKTHYKEMAKERARDFSNDKYVQKLLDMVEYKEIKHEENNVSLE